MTSLSRRQKVVLALILGTIISVISSMGIIPRQARIVGQLCFAYAVYVTLWETDSK